MDIKKIEAFTSNLQKSLVEKSDFYAMTVSSVGNVCDKYFLSVEELDNLLFEIGNVIKSLKNKKWPVFIVCSEYLISRNPLYKDQDYDHFYSKSDINQEIVYNKFCDFSDKYPNAIIWLNLLQVGENKLSDEELIKINIYKETIDFGNGTIWNPTVGYGTSTVNSDLSRYFFNGTSVILHGKKIFSYRKCTYCDGGKELLTNGYTYYYGFGKIDLEEGLSKEYLKIAEVLNQYTEIDVCWDMQKHIRKYSNIIHQNDWSGKAEVLQLQINSLKDVLRKDVRAKIPKVRIVQSNTTDLSEVLGDFRDCDFVIQSDPLVSSVYRISHKDVKYIFNKIKDDDVFETKKSAILKQNFATICSKYHPVKSKIVQKHNTCEYRIALYEVAE